MSEFKYKVRYTGRHVAYIQSATNKALANKANNAAIRESITILKWNKLSDSSIIGSSPCHFCQSQYMPVNVTYFYSKFSETIVKTKPRIDVCRQVKFVIVVFHSLKVPSTPDSAITVTATIRREQQDYQELGAI